MVKYLHLSLKIAKKSFPNFNIKKQILPKILNLRKKKIFYYLMMIRDFPLSPFTTFCDKPLSYIDPIPHLTDPNVESSTD